MYIANSRYQYLRSFSFILVIVYFAITKFVICGNTDFKSQVKLYHDTFIRV